jgi:hypothetical protein
MVQYIEGYRFQDTRRAAEISYIWVDVIRRLLADEVE